MDSHIDDASIRRAIGLRRALRESRFRRRSTAGIYARAIGMQVVISERAGDEERVSLDVSIAPSGPAFYATVRGYGTEHQNILRRGTVIPHYAVRYGRGARVQSGATVCGIQDNGAVTYRTAPIHTSAPKRGVPLNDAVDDLPTAVETAAGA